MDRASISLRLPVTPGATRSEIVGRHGEVWKIRIHAPPKDGQATRAVVDLLAKTFEISRARNEIRRGHASRDKSVLIHGVTNDEAERRLAAWEAT